MWYTPVYDVKMYYFVAAEIGKTKDKKVNGLRFLSYNKHSTNCRNNCCHPTACRMNTINNLVRQDPKS